MVVNDGKTEKGIENKRKKEGEAEWIRQATAFENGILTPGLRN